MPPVSSLSNARVAEWLMAADCKSADKCLRRFESFPWHHVRSDEEQITATILVTSASIAQSVERVLGKDEVTGSNPVGGSRYYGEGQCFAVFI